MSLIASLSYQQAQRLASSLWSNKFAHTADGSQPQPWGDEEKPASRWTLSSVCWSSASSTCSRKYTCRLIYSRAREMSTLVNVWIICLEGAVWGPSAIVRATFFPSRWTSKRQRFDAHARTPHLFVCARGCCLGLLIARAALFANSLRFFLFVCAGGTECCLFPLGN